MTTSEQIRVLCVRTGVSLSELARRINQTPQNFNANPLYQGEAISFLQKKISKTKNFLEV